MTSPSRRSFVNAKRRFSENKDDPIGRTVRSLTLDPMRL